VKPKPRFLGPDYASQFEDTAVAAVYRSRPPYPPETFDLILDLLPTSGGHILDIGSGTGELAIPLAERAGAVDAVEPSAAMLAVAQTQPHHELVNWHNVAAERFVYRKAYDLIVCGQCLGWLDWEVVFPSFIAALGTDGLLAIVSQQALDDFPWQSELTELIARYSTNQDFEPFHLIAGLTERRLFEECGSAETPPMTFHQPIDRFIDSVHARNGFSRERMPADDARGFDEQVRRLLTNHHPDGILRGTSVARIVWGRPLPT